jgi:outer membrane biosynthesis protein TonB
MNGLRSVAALTVCIALTLLPGCAKKKPTVVAASQPPAPQATPTPEQPSAPAESQTSSQGTPPPEQTPTPAEAQAEPTPSDTDKAKPATKPRTPTKKPAETARNTKPRIVVKPEPEPSSPSGTISPSISSSDASQEQNTTDQLLQKTENNLNGIKRQLSPDEQALVNQIRDYMKQSREATKQNDLVRARNLAVKAQLLCDELVKKR